METLDLKKNEKLEKKNKYDGQTQMNKKYESLFITDKFIDNYTIV